MTEAEKMVAMMFVTTWIMTFINVCILLVCVKLTTEIWKVRELTRK